MVTEAEEQAEMQRKIKDAEYLSEKLGEAGDRASKLQDLLESGDLPDLDEFNEKLDQALDRVSKLQAALEDLPGVDDLIDRLSTASALAKDLEGRV